MIQYDIAALVGPNLYASKVRQLLGETREVVLGVPAEEFGRRVLDARLREVAKENEVSGIELFRLLRVTLQWPDARPDFFEQAISLGQAGVIARIDAALVSLGTLAG